MLPSISSHRWARHLMVLSEGTLVHWSQSGLHGRKEGCRYMDWVYLCSLGSDLCIPRELLRLWRGKKKNSFFPITATASSSFSALKKMILKREKVLVYLLQAPSSYLSFFSKLQSSPEFWLNVLCFAINEWSVFTRVSELLTLENYPARP